MLDLQEREGDQSLRGRGFGIRSRKLGEGYMIGDVDVDKTGWKSLAGGVG